MILHSKIIGEGTPFVILHGFLGMGDNWKTMGAKIATLGYQVHLVDQRNHGRSFHNEVFNYEVLTQDLKQYVDFHQIDQMVLLGHSMGGKTAMYYATQYPAQVTQLIVADIAPKAYPSHHNHILESLNLLAHQLPKLDSRQKADHFLAAYIPELGIRQFLLKNLYWQQPGSLGLRTNIKVLKEKGIAVGAALPASRVFERPTLFLKGSRSDYIKDEDVISINNAFAKAQVRTIPRAGHWLHAENPKDFYTEVLNFL